MYSASVVKRATVGCFFELHDTAPSARVNTYPEKDFRSSPAAKAASLYPSRTNSSLALPWYVIPRSEVPLWYRIVVHINVVSHSANLLRYWTTSDFEPCEERL
jgi:hypothetical protein